MQRQLEKSRIVDISAQKRQDAWRSQVKYLEPGLLVAPESKQASQNLVEQISDDIRNSFHSSVLLRLISEVLLVLGESFEAWAALETYVSYQKLHELKTKTGASNDFRDKEDCVLALFSQFFRAIHSGVFAENGKKIDMVRFLRKSLSEIVDVKGRPEARALIGRMLTLESSHCIDGDFETAISEANAEFEAAIGMGLTLDSEAAYAYGLILARLKSPHDAFEITQPALAKDPTHRRLGNLVALLLTSEGQLNSALELVEGYATIEDSTKLGPVSLLEEIELRKTQIAIIEALEGAPSALELIPHVMDLLHEEIKVIPSDDSRPALKARTSSRVFGFIPKTREIVLKPPPETKTDLVPTTVAAQTWLWTARLYLRAGQHEEAIRAADHASELDPEDVDFHVTLGQIDMARNPARSLRHFQHCLAHRRSDSLAACISLGILLQDQEKAGSLFQDPGDERSTYLSTLSLLQSLTVRNPGKFVPEAFLVLGRLYEHLGEEKNAISCYWKSIALAEKQGVRDYPTY